MSGDAEPRGGDEPLSPYYDPFADTQSGNATLNDTNAAPFMASPPSSVATQSHALLHAEPAGSGFRGQRHARLLLALVIVSGLGLGMSVYNMVAALPTAVLEPAGLSLWSGLALLAVVVLLGSLVGAIVATVKCRPRLTAIIALVLAVLLPPLATLIGVKFGVEAAWSSVNKQVTSLAEDTSSLMELLRRLSEWVGGP